MKKSLLLIATIIYVAGISNAQNKVDSTVSVSEVIKDTTYWDLGGSISVNFNNTSLSNWAAGGQNSMALGSIVDLFAKYKKDKDDWTTSLTWAAGLSKVGDKKNLLKKSDDQFILFSKYRRNIKPLWGFAAFAELRTQLLKSPIYRENPESTETNDEKYEIKTNQYASSFMSAGYLTSSIGWEYNKGKDFYIHASPLSGRGTFVLDDSLSTLGLYGLDPNSKLLFQVGSLIRTGFKTTLMENVTLMSNLTLFSPYQKYGNIDVTWETLTSFKINKFLTTTFSTQLLYYDSSRPKLVEETVEGVKVKVAKHGVQFKHVLNIGFLAKF